MEDVLIRSANNHDSPIHDCVKELYHNDLDFEHLDLQLKMFPDVMKQEPKIKEITKISTICQVLVGNPPIKKLLSEVDKLLKLYLTVPVTSAPSERTNSTLKRIKSYLRSTMTQQRMNNVLICHAMKERTDKLDLIQIAKLFVSVNEERQKYFGQY